MPLPMQGGWVALCRKLRLLVLGAVAADARSAAYCICINGTAIHNSYFSLITALSVHHHCIPGWFCNPSGFAALAGCSCRPAELASSCD